MFVIKHESKTMKYQATKEGRIPAILCTSPSANLPFADTWRENSYAENKCNW